MAADPFLEGLLDLTRRQGRPAAAGYAGRYAVLDSGPDREKIWLIIGVAAPVWPGGVTVDSLPRKRRCDLRKWLALLVGRE